MSVLHEIEISPFRPSDQEAVKALILAGLVEHWGFLDPSLNPDLNDIRSAYAGSDFLVARLANRIVGTGALVPRQERTAEIVRMSVASDLRRCGLGRRILERLIELARQRGYRRIVLETTASWQEVIRFYLRCGFSITHYQGEDVYFEKILDHPQISQINADRK